MHTPNILHISCKQKNKIKFSLKRLDKAQVVCYNMQVNQIWCHGQAVRQRSATPLSPVRFRVAPPTQKALRMQCLLCWRCHSFIEPGFLAPRGRKKSGSHSPPEDRQATRAARHLPGAGRANSRQRRDSGSTGGVICKQIAPPLPLTLRPFYAIMKPTTRKAVER